MLRITTAINLIEIIKEFLRKISRKIPRIKNKNRIIPIIFLKLFSENNEYFLQDNMDPTSQDRSDS